VIVAVGSVLAIDLIWLRAGWTALQETTISAAAAGTVEVQGTPGHRTLNPDAAREATRGTLQNNLAALPFLADTPEQIAQQAQIYVGNPPPGHCMPDPLGGPQRCAPFVSVRARAAVRLPWSGGKIVLPLRAVAETGTSPQ
jgi:hypothetical protein